MFQGTIEGTVSSSRKVEGKAPLQGSVSVTEERSGKEAGSRKAYVMNHFLCTRSQYKYVVELTGKDFHKRRAVAHLIASTLVQAEEEWELRSRPTFVPVPCKIWDRELGGAATWKQLRKDGILRIVTKYNREEGKCREFLIHSLVIDEYIRRGTEDEKKTTLNLMTGQGVRRGLRTRLNDRNRHPVFPGSEANQKALTLLAEERCPINLDAMRQEVEKFYLVARQSPTQGNRRRLIIAACAYQTIRRSPTLKPDSQFGPGIHSYIPAYKVLSTGRIIEMGLGVQGCPRILKAAAFSGIPDVYNFDMRDCQAWALLRLIGALNKAIGHRNRKRRAGHRLSGIQRGWLRSYLEGQQAQHYADLTGVPKDLWKKAFYAVIMGGTLGGTVRDLVEEFHEGKVAESWRTMVQMRKELAPLVRIVADLTEILKKWSLDPWGSPYRLQKPDQRMLRYVQNSSGTLALNATGADLLVRDRTGRWAEHADGESLVGTRHIVAHVLQGLEAEYIAILTEIGPEHGYRVVSNQHDGVVTVGAIPQKALNQAVRRSLLSNYAHLVPKPFY